MSDRSFDITFLITFFVILIFALSLDLMDFIWELIGFPLQKSRTVALSATKFISAGLDVITAIVIGGWTYWVQKKRPAGKKEVETPTGGKAQPATPTAESAATPEESEGQKTRPTGAGEKAPPGGAKPKAIGGIGGKKAILSTLRISGLGLLGEVLPIIGMAPFWTLTVIKTFLNVIKEK